MHFNNNPAYYWSNSLCITITGDEYVLTCRWLAIDKNGGRSMIGCKFTAFSFVWKDSFGLRTPWLDL
jgi:hypothetical protein